MSSRATISSTTLREALTRGRADEETFTGTSPNATVAISVSVSVWPFNSIAASQTSNAQFPTFNVQSQFFRWSQTVAIEKERGQVVFDLASLRKINRRQQARPPNLFPVCGRSWGHYFLVLRTST